MDLLEKQDAQPPASPMAGRDPLKTQPTARTHRGNKPMTAGEKAREFLDRKRICGTRADYDLLLELLREFGEEQFAAGRRRELERVANNEIEKQLELAKFVFQCLRAGSNADEILTAISEGKDVPKIA